MLHCYVYLTINKSSMPMSITDSLRFPKAFQSTRTYVNSYLSQLVPILVNSYLIFGQLVPTRVNSYLFWSTRTYFSQLVPVFGQLVPFIKKD